MEEEKILVRPSGILQKLINPWSTTLSDLHLQKLFRLGHGKRGSRNKYQI